MLRIQRALLGELGLMALVCVGILTGILFSGFAVSLVSRTGGGMGTGLLLEVLPDLLPLAVMYSLPFGWLVAVTFVVGRWVNDHELTSLRAAGVHVRALALPVVAASALLALAGMTISAWVVPASQKSVREGTRDYVQVFLESLRGADRSVMLGGVRLSFERFADGAFHDVELDRRDPNLGTLEMKVVAKRLELSQVHIDGEGSGLKLGIEDGLLIRSVATGEPEVADARGTEIHVAQVEQLGGSTVFSSFLRLSRFLARPRDMDLGELLYGLERGEVWRGPRNELERSFHTRLAHGAAPFAMGVFALAVALLLPPTGRRVRDFLLVFVPATLIFYPLQMASGTLARTLPVPTWVPVWAPVIALSAAGLCLLARAARR